MHWVGRPWYNGGMSDREHDLTATAVVLVAVMTMIAAVAFGALILAIIFRGAFLFPLGALLGAIVVRRVVRSINRRDECRSRPDRLLGS